MEWQCSDWNSGHSGLDAAARVWKAVGQVLEKHMWGNEMPRQGERARKGSALVRVWG